jgi:hypothetical protein
VVVPGGFDFRAARVLCSREASAWRRTMGTLSESYERVKPSIIAVAQTVNLDLFKRVPCAQGVSPVVKYMAIFPDWFEKFATVDWNTDQVVFYDADSTYKYASFLGVGLKRNTISSRNTMYVYQRMGRYETGVHKVPVVAH